MRALAWSPLTPGMWLVTAEGVVGEGRETWRSELLKLEIPEPNTAK